MAPEARCILQRSSGAVGVSQNGEFLAGLVSKGNQKETNVGGSGSRHTQWGEIEHIQIRETTPKADLRMVFILGARPTAFGMRGLQKCPPPITANADRMLSLPHFSTASWKRGSASASLPHGSDTRTLRHPEPWKPPLQSEATKGDVQKFKRRV